MPESEVNSEREGKRLLKESSSQNRKEIEKGHGGR